MRSAVAIAFAAGALAVPYKRDIVTDIDVVYETKVFTVWATASETSSVAVAPVEPSSSSSSSSVAHYGHNHWSYHYSSSESTTTESTSTYVEPTPSSTSTTPTSTYVPPPSTSSSVYVAPTPSTTSSTWVYVAPTPSSTYVAPFTSSTSVYVAPSSSSASSAPAAKPTSYSETVVYHHNIHRANHSAPDLTWSDDLAKSAQDIAASCIYAHNVDADGGGYGQNIAAGVEASNISAIITDLFYNGEVGWFNNLYGQAQPDMTNFESWGHFSQIVWKDTTSVGCATQYCPNGLGNVGSDVSPYFTVCNYKNPGNYANEYGSNIGASLNRPTAEWNAGM